MVRHLFLALILPLILPFSGIAADITNSPKTNAGASGASSPDGGGGKSSRLLVGSIKHSDSLPPLPDELNAGNIFTGTTAKVTKTETVQKTSASAPVAVPFSKQAPQTIKPPTPASVSAKCAGSLKAMPDVSRQLRSYLKKQSKTGSGAGTYGLNNYLQAEKNDAVQPKKQLGNLRTLSPQTTTTTTTQSMGTVSPLGQLRRFQIPPWLAGVWLRSDSNEVSRTDLANGKTLKAAGKSVSRVKDSFGTYKDGRGIIWQIFDPAKASGSVDRGDSVDYHTVREYKIANVSANEAVVMVGATHVVVNKKTHRIVTSYQDEELNRFYKIDANKLRTDSSVKVFDAKGKPHLLTKAESTEVRVDRL